jgi:hypothetical protein
VLKITDGVMRHMATRRPKGGGRTAPPPPLPHVEAERTAEPDTAVTPVVEAEGDADAGAVEEYPERAERESEQESEGGA